MMVRRTGELTLKLLLALLMVVSPALILPVTTSILAEVATADGWIGPVIGQATAASILAAVVLWLGPRAITAWQQQQETLINRLTAEMAEQRDTHAAGVAKVAEQMEQERRQCAAQFERLMSAHAQVVERLTEIKGVIFQARHVSVAVEGRGGESHPGR